MVVTFAEKPLRRGLKMKPIIYAVMGLLGLSVTIVEADFLGDADDAYLGFQMTTPIDSKFRGLIAAANRYDLVLIQQRNELKHGLAITRDIDGNQVLNYLAPSAGFEIGTGSIPEYAIPIVRLDETASIESHNSASSGAGALVALAIVAAWIKHDLEKPWKPASPD